MSNFADVDRVVRFAGLIADGMSFRKSARLARLSIPTGIEYAKRLGGGALEFENSPMLPWRAAPWYVVPDDGPCLRFLTPPSEDREDVIVVRFDPATGLAAARIDEEISSTDERTYRLRRLYSKSGHREERFAVFDSWAAFHGIESPAFRSSLGYPTRDLYGAWNYYSFVAAVHNSTGESPTPLMRAGLLDYSISMDELAPHLLDMDHSSLRGRPWPRRPIVESATRLGR